MMMIFMLHKKDPNKGIRAPMVGRYVSNGRTVLTIGSISRI